MAFSDDVINNPNFGRMYRTNSNFRSLVDRFALNHPNTALAKLLGKIRIDVSSQNAVRFGVENRSEMFVTMEDALRASADPISRTAMYTGRRGKTAMTGPYTNGIANFLADKFGVDVKVTNFKVNAAGSSEDAVLEALDQIIGRKGKDYLGLPVVDQEQINILQIFKGNKALTLDQILTDILGAPSDEIQDVGTIFKRLKVLTSERAIFNIVDPTVNDRIKIASFDPQKFFSSDPVAKRSAEDMARLVSGSPGSTLSFSEALKEVYNTMADGLSFMTQESYQAQLDITKKQGMDMIHRARAGKASSLKGSFEYKEFEKLEQEGRKVVQKAAQSSKDFEKGLTSNVRIISPQDVTGRIADPRFFKGDIAPLTQSELDDLIRRGEVNLPHGTKIKDIAAFVPSSDHKPEMRIGSFSGITFEAQGMPKRAETNILTLATFRHHLGVDYLKTGLEDEANEAIEGLRKGEIKPGLLNMIEELKNWSPLESEGPAAAAAAREGRAFAIRLEKLIGSNIPIQMHDSSATEMFSAIKRHYTKYQKGKYGQKLVLDGEQIPQYALRFPMMGSTSAHVRNIHNVRSLERPDGGLSGTIQIDWDRGRYGLLGMDIFRAKHAFGGFDLDDRLYSILQYDSSTKRLLALTLRDPNELGEFMYFDADITHDKNIPREIKSLYGKLQGLKMKIAAGQERSPQSLNRMIAEHDELSETLDRWFRGYSVTVKNKRGTRKVVESQNYIKEVNLSERFGRTRAGVNVFAAPKGYQTDIQGYTRSSFFRGFSSSDEILGLSTHGVDAASQLSYLARLELQEEGTAQAGRGIFKFVGHDTDYFHKQTGFFSDETMNLPRGSKTGPRLSADAIERRIRQESMSQGILGRFVNQGSFLDEFVQTNLADLSDEDAEKFIEELKKTKFGYLTRETIIDAYTKEGNEEILTKAEEIIQRNANSLGSLIGTMHERGVTSSFGLDPLFYSQRFASNAKANENLLMGYAHARGITLATDEDRIKVRNLLLLDENDPKAVVTSLFRFKHAFGDTLETKSGEISKEATENFLGALKDSGVDLSDAQLQSDAKEFINDYVNRSKANRSLEQLLDKTHPSDLKNVLTGMLDDTAGLSDEEAALMRSSLIPEDINMGSIRKLWQLGYLKENMGEDGLKSLSVNDKTRKLVLAIAQMASENKMASDSAESVLGMLSTVSPDGTGISMLDIFSEAMNKHVISPKMIGQIRGVNSLDDLYKIIDKDTLSLTAEMSRIFDPVERDFELMRAVARVSQNERISLEHTYRGIDPSDIDSLDSIRRESNNLFRTFTDNQGTTHTSILQEIQDSIYNRVSKRGRYVRGDLDKIHGEVSDIVSQQFNKGWSRTMMDSSKLAMVIPDMPNLRRRATSIKPGSGRFLQRMTADNAAEYVITARNVKERMTRFSGESWSKLMEIPMFRKGAMVAGVFAAVGVIYGATRDRTPEDMQGPPLLPGGSAYEDFSDSEMDMSSIYPSVNNRSGFGNNQGVLYRVNTYGSSSSSNSIQNALAEITGATSTIGNMYNARETIKSRGNSQAVLNERVG